MRKIISFIAFLSLPIIIFLAFDLRNNYVNKNISLAQEVPSKDNVYIDMQIQKYGYKSNLGEEIFEIPLFVSKNGDNKEINKLNSAIAPLLNYYNGNYGFKQDEGTVEIKSYPFTSSAYLQVITTATIYPNYDTQGDVYSYNYDIKNEKMLNLKDAYIKDNKSENEVINEIITIYNDIKLDKNTNCLDVQVKGFLIGDDSIKYFVYISMINDKSGDCSKIFIYDSTYNTLEEYNGSCLVNPNEPDNFQPELCYKRDDIMEKYYAKSDNVLLLSTDKSKNN